MNNMTLGQYIPGDSLVHKLDPRVKILLVIFYMIFLFLIQDLLFFIPMFAFVLLVVKVANLNFFKILKSLKSIIFILAFTTIIHLFATPGRELYSFWGLTITYEGVERAVFIGVRLILLIIGTSYLTLTTSTTKLTDGLESLFSPLKIIKLPFTMMVRISMKQLCQICLLHIKKA